MSTPDYFEVDPYIVGLAGEQTTATAEAWQTWGDRARTRLEVAGPDLVSTRVSAALGDYAALWCPELQAVSAEVAALGISTAGAANVIGEADRQAADSLAGDAAEVCGQQSVLRRPINGEQIPW